MSLKYEPASVPQHISVDASTPVDVLALFPPRLEGELARASRQPGTGSALCPYGTGYRRVLRSARTRPRTRIVAGYEPSASAPVGVLALLAPRFERELARACI